MINLLMWVVLN